MRALIRRRAARPDPAPSRLAYKWERLWLTPAFRRAVRRGVPALALAAGLAAWLHDGDEFAAAAAAWRDLRAGIEARPEFAVATAEVAGASDALRAEVEALLPPLPASSFALDLDALRDALAEVPGVAAARVRVARGGVLRVAVEERRPVALWRRGALHALAIDGRVVREVAARSDHPDLPLLAGEGAPDAVAEALAVIEGAGALAPTLVGLVRVGERRWDAVLPGGRRVLLPAHGAPEAMARAALLEARGLGERAVLDVDLRDPRRAVLGLAPGARELMDERRAEALRAAREAARAAAEETEGEAG